MDLKLDAMELRLGLPGTADIQKSSPSPLHSKRSSAEIKKSSGGGGAPVPKQQVVGWPPVRPYRKNIIQQQKLGKTGEADSKSGGIFVKVSMDGAPYLRKIDISFYNNYGDLLKALENMYKCNLERDGRSSASSYAATYQDRDGDWMLVGDVPWEMFVTSCKRMRIMKGSEAKGLQVQVQQLFTK